VSEDSMFYVGLDLGARYTHYCVVDGDGDVVEEGRISSTCEALEQWSERHPGAKVAMETGTQTRWMAALLDERGHEVVVGNARRLRAIFGHERKCDKRDAEMLARLLRSDPSLLSPVRGLLQRDTEALAVVRTRAFLVSQRTNLVNHIRGVARTAGFPLRSCASKRAHLLQGDLPARLQPALGGVFETLATVTEQIDKLDAEIAKLCEVTYTETQVLQSIPGVGPVTALYFVLVIGNPERFLCARDVAAYVGLVPRRSQSGDGDPEKGIAKTGDTLPAQTAHHGGAVDVGSVGQTWGAARVGLAQGRRRPGGEEARGDRGGSQAVGADAAIVAHGRELRALARGSSGAASPTVPGPRGPHGVMPRR
jgi:transposase